MSVFPIMFDPDRWVRVPVDWTDEQWPDAAAWADWVADELTRDRESAAQWAPLVREEAAGIAGFPSEHVSARFWHFPIDGAPAGWVDVFAQLRPSDGTDATGLLPDIGPTLIEPAVLEFEETAFESAVRRLSLVPLGEDVLGPDQTGMLAKGEWSAVAGDWAIYLVSIDADPRRLTSRLGDIDQLLAGIDPSALMSLPETSAR